MQICPSIASGDIMNLEKTAIYLEKKYGHIHVDIEDGNYIGNITFGMKALKGIRRAAACDLSVHLMVTDPLQYLRDIAEANPKIVFFHPDSTRYPSEVIDAYRTEGIPVGLAFNPAGDMESYRYLFHHKVKDVLIMTCEPDGYGQKYIASMENRIRNCISDGLITWVDGAVTLEKASQLEYTGVDYIVMGRAVFN